eukprot:TRINITY_DN72939_c0_g1_i1.p1 TRINITY_DN72939_c0_g1~~TRINITY_DN72939_c0_g1_i1.p1  ORF type:complete len:378 (-),score=83.28 TRINITY_DN72939_c0_g1_i1:151-1209(-)
MAAVSKRDKVLAHFRDFNRDGGAGTIDRRVLAAVLLEVGGTALTAGQIGALLTAFNPPSDKDNVPENRIPCADFVDWVFTRPGGRQRAVPKAKPLVFNSPRTPRPKSASAAVRSSGSSATSPAVHAYLSSFIAGARSFEDTADVAKMIKAREGSNPEEMQALRAELLSRSKDHLCESQCESVRALFEEFDADGDGALSVSECGHLVEAYLHRSSEASEELVRASVDLAVGLQATLAAKSQGGDPGGRIDARATARAAAIRKRVAPAVRDMLEGLRTKNPEDLAAELLEALPQRLNGACSSEAAPGDGSAAAAAAIKALPPGALERGFLEELRQVLRRAQTSETQRKSVQKSC